MNDNLPTSISRDGERKEVHRHNRQPVLLPRTVLRQLPGHSHNLRVTRHCGVQVSGVGGDNKQDLCELQLCIAFLIPGCKFIVGGDAGSSLVEE